MDTDWLRLNREYWDERVPLHAASPFYDVPGFLGGRDVLRPFEHDEVGDVRGKRLFFGLERGDDGLWRFPPDRFQIPMMFSLRAARDGSAAPE